jgi:hypothetical protein
MPPAAHGHLLSWTDCLLDPTCPPLRQREAAHAWADWAMGRLGIEPRALDGSANPFGLGTHLPSGQAISPQRAALCVLEYRRTAQFLQAMRAAITRARRDFPNETIHVVEAGCGPLAALTLPFALRFPPDEVNFTWIDWHRESLDAAQQLAAELGVSASVRAAVAGDASQVKFAEAERPHVIGCEVLRRALKAEPQVAVTRALAPQLRPGGSFVPQRIEVAAGLLHSDRLFRRLPADALDAPVVAPSAPVFVLDARRPPPPGRHLPGGALTVPPHDRGRTPLRLFTRLQLDDAHALEAFECSLTMPEPLDYPPELARCGGRCEFSYEVSRTPGVRLERIVWGVEATERTA